MLTADMIDVTPLPRVPLLAKDDYTGRTTRIRAGANAGKTLHVGKLLTCRHTGGAQFYLVSVDGGKVAWCAAEVVRGEFE